MCVIYLQFCWIKITYGRMFLTVIPSVPVYVQILVKFGLSKKFKIFNSAQRLLSWNLFLVDIARVFLGIFKDFSWHFQVHAILTGFFSQNIRRVYNRFCYF